MTERKIYTLKRLKKTLAVCKKRGERIVFTNGCFDILHLGHIKYLEKAASYGDKLVVAVNSDASVRKIKGRGRPVFPAKERAYIVAGLKFVDYVIVFSELTPLRLIKSLKPDILAKGADWPKAEIVGREFVESRGGEVVCIKFIKGYSTSSILNKIRK